MDLHTFSRFNRFRVIILTLAKYGFGDIVTRLDLPERILPVQRKKHGAQELNTWQRIRLVLEELGPSFIKLGQLLSLRTDLIPPSLAMELAKLQDAVPHEEFEAIKSRVEKSLHRPFHEVFQQFDEQPLAAASLAQVHKAVLLQEKEVVAVKVQRPGIRQTIRNDMAILEYLADRIHERVEALQFYDLPMLVAEMKKLLTEELDFEREARNIRLATNSFNQDPYLYLPRVFREYTTPQVLVLELINGTKLKDAVSLPEEERRKIALRWMRATLKQVLEDGFFHADPHPGNIFVLPDGRYSLLDWGMVGRLTPGTRFKLINLVEGVVEKDSELVLEALLEFTHQYRPVAKEELHRELMDILDDYYAVPLKDINIGALLTSMTELFRAHKLRIRSDLATMIKGLVTAEGSARLLYPDLDVINEATPFIRRLAFKKYSPRSLLRLFRGNLSNLFKMQQDLPLQINHVLTKLENDELSIGFEHKRLEGLRQTLDHITNRLTLGIVTAAMIIGSSMIITTGVEPFIFGYPALGLIGYLLSALIGGWLIIDIIRRRKY